MTLLCRSRTAAASACRRRFSSGSRTIEVISPRDGKPFATLQDWSAADVDAAVTRGRRHLASSWASRGAVDGRCDVLRRMGAALRERLEEFSQLETHMQSSTPLRGATAADEAASATPAEPLYFV